LTKLYAKYTFFSLRENMKTVINKLGNSLYIRLPEKIISEFSLKDGSSVEIKEENGKIIITPHKNSLNELLDMINDNNLHDEVYSGEPVGKEY
jgi:antitoxin MazE